MVQTSFDAVDRAILSHLQENARKPITDIADALGVADNTVRNRIDRMEDDGVIEGYQVNVDYEEIGVQHYYVFSCTARVSEREPLARQAREHDGVVEVITLMTGRENVLIVAASGEKDGITDLAVKIDELGLDIEREHLVREHVRQPYSGFQLEHNL